ncbi:oxidoreductase [Alkalihalobacillus alcalophilus ATCC 27647 = CGMCC 1.3604]|uniref:Oxidoreductase n=1 Tax=Alkalihalobacillus alcalophilus ATCC 27647 = CGMCC 1.3604 TaxID=1218173 RepID=A0A094XE80_ALKAL|nr:SDR family oxidoreductase [Alkalihalobacillus alcalophilus]KGA97095.1 oxidoreductase [Alkalihalobacillus alcalophilus ATCC 27647 = CGMCC 1.3604]MED1563064.1 SDR family oxidoreductase [Alkalihalobacillus alcalophilus]THG88995.1 oxidoreductase [Alkalihalobacillus alcalophilus ATCC 27647 = CGMCC 1.3604]
MKKTIWITGGTSGLGKEIAFQLLKKDYHVIVLARNEEKIKQLEEEAQGFNGRILTCQVDIRSDEEVKKIVAHLVKSGHPVDVLINNAGLGIFDSVLDAKTEDIVEMFEVNVLGLIAMTKAVLPYMIEKKSGQIIQIASQAGKLATPKSSVYAATKHAVLGFTNSLRMEVEDDNVNVSAVNPGPIQTPFFERADKTGSYVKNVGKMMLKPEYVAERVVQLIEKPKRELNLPRWMGFGSKCYQLMPTVIEKIAGKQLKKK